ncbi:Pentatricopeptide repeat-containing protein 1, mitochondrial [Chionoecetes opilio]|uniref:Pentatricopeptide repeat-containing protein 1, mitochondrial n=1 Tax=Chionoecetes opilio TaxID=41210 RepID=A0A8J5CQY0_CHIOP|nr:Pentatricopeptide repeat-containing protein 1, mitochondrial [Chionoecetes opilio]
MPPPMHFMKGWRRLCSLYQCRFHHQHLRLLTSSAAKSESDGNTDKGNSFGQLAASIKKNTAEKKVNRSTETISKEHRGLHKPVQDYSCTGKDSTLLKQENILEKWHQFREAEHKDTVVRWGDGQQDDAEEDYQYFVSKRTSKSVDQGGALRKVSGGKGSYQKAVESPKEKITESSISERKQQNSARKGRTFESPNPQSAEPVGDEGDLREERYQRAKLERKHRPHFYGFKMKKLCKERKLAEAIKILEEEMPTAGTKPDNFCFQVLINACGRAGYTKKAFQLYNQMKKRGLTVEPVAYTGLFLACAHSPWPTTDGLQRATHLRSYLKEKRYQFNQIVSHTMIKAFGWCGDMSTAFIVVDEMIQDEVLVTTETMNFLLQACITNKEVGFRHAVKVWRKMRELKLQPDIHSYNLLMRVVKECGAGDHNLTFDLLREDSDPHRLKDTQPSRNTHNLTPEVLKLKVDSLDHEKNQKNAPEDSVAPLENDDVVKNVEKDISTAVLPNIIGKKLTRGDVVALGPLDNSPDRLALLGGPSGVLMQMKRDRVTPDLKTFTQMLESLPPDTLAEQALLESMKNLNLEPDIQFFNMLIKKRNYRRDREAAQEVLTHMQHYHVIPDLITYGCLALGCGSFHTATQLLKNMDSNQFRPNQEIMGSLIKNSLVCHDYRFTVAMLQEMQQRAIPPNDFMLSMLEKTRTKARNIQLEKHFETSRMGTWFLTLAASSKVNPEAGFED